MATRLELGQLPGRLGGGLLVPGELLAPAWQQHLHGNNDHGADRPYCLARKLRTRTHAAAASMDRHRHRVADLCDTLGVSGDSVRASYEGVRTDRQPVV